MTKNAYLCKQCGNITYIEDIGFEIIYNTYTCKCNKRITVEDSYPNLQARDLIFSAEEIYENSIKKDQTNKDNFTFLLKKDNLNLDELEINSIITLYEENKFNYLDNNQDSYLPSFNNLDNKLFKKGYNVVQIDTLISALAVSMRNKMRKPFIVMASSAIEMLFNDYFNELINHILEENGAKIIKKQFNKDSISKCITIANGLLNGNFFDKANNISHDFTKKWDTLREYRNKIVHNNELFITENIVKDTMNLLNESIKVFLNLKSELYKN